MNLRTPLAAVGLAAPLTLAALAVPPAASAATTAHHTVVPATTLVLSLANSPGAGSELTAEGSNQAEISFNGSNLTEGNCGSIAGQPVRAFNNQNGKFMKWTSGNGHIIFTTESTNGCANNAMKFVKVPSPDGFYLEPYTNVNYFTGANSDASGALIFAAGSPSWKQWCFLGNSGCP